jgi:hypothetical protein
MGWFSGAVFQSSGLNSRASAISFVRGFTTTSYTPYTALRASLGWPPLNSTIFMPSSVRTPTLHSESSPPDGLANLVVFGLAEREVDLAVTRANHRAILHTFLEYEEAGAILAYFHDPLWRAVARLDKLELEGRVVLESDRAVNGARGEKLRVFIRVGRMLLDKLRPVFRSTLRPTGASREQQHRQNGQKLFHRSPRDRLCQLSQDFAPSSSTDHSRGRYAVIQRVDTA